VNLHARSEIFLLLKRPHKHKQKHFVGEQLSEQVKTRTCCRRRSVRCTRNVGTALNSKTSHAVTEKDKEEEAITLIQRHKRQLQLQWRCCVTNRAGMQSIGLHPQTLTYDPKATCSPGMPFNGLHSRNPPNYMDYLLFTDPEGMKGLVG